MHKYILYIATFIILANYLFWSQINKLVGVNCFDKLQATFIMLLCLFVFLNFRKIWISFFLFSLSLNNLFDEMFFNPLVFGLNEILFAIFITIIIVVKYALQKYSRRND